MKYSIPSFITGVFLGAAVLWGGYSYGLLDFIAPPSNETEAPFDETLLESPLIYSWTVAVQGILTHLDETTMVIEGPDARLTLAVTSGTRFYTRTEELFENDGVPLPEVPMGSRVEGSVFVAGSSVLDTPGTQGTAGIFFLTDEQPPMPLQEQ